jgi:hypothetical protein
MDDDARLARIEQQLRDERRLRDAAERKAADQATKAATWRRRAEERSARIDDLVDQRDQLRTPAGLAKVALKVVRRSSGAPAADALVQPAPRKSAAPRKSPARTAPRAAARRSVALPNVQIGHLVEHEDLARAVAEMTPHELADGGAGWVEADLLVVEQATLAAASVEVREQFATWVALDARQPLVWVGDDAPTTGPVTVVRPGDASLRVTFDPALDTPVGRAGTAVAGPGEVVPFDPTDRDHVRAAARADAVSGALDPVREGDLRRRLAWQRHTPASVAVDLVTAAGWSFEDPTPEVTALLVSNRPDDLRDQLRAMPSQRHPRLRVRVGCHGFSSSEVADALRDVDGVLPVEVLELPSTRELGWCLNRVAEGAASSILAKIDDDDHYGPGYLIDAVQALTYADAGIVGRVCGFTHLEGAGKTVLRRVGTEEMPYDGTLVGATMVFRRSVWERSPFPHKTLAEDVALQRGCRSMGETVYVASRWDFVYRRRQGANTWRVPDEHFLADATDAWGAWEPQRADLEP